MHNLLLKKNVLTKFKTKLLFKKQNLFAAFYFKAAKQSDCQGFFALMFLNQ